MNNNTDPNAGEGVQNAQNNAGQTQEPVKTYTKEDLDNSFNAGVRKASTEWQKDEKYKEFLEWKKTNQNDSEKIAELETNNTNLSNQVSHLKAQIKINERTRRKRYFPCWRKSPLSFRLCPLSVIHTQCTIILCKARSIT